MQGWEGRFNCGENVAAKGKARSRSREDNAGPGYMKLIGSISICNFRSALGFSAPLSQKRT